MRWIWLNDYVSGKPRLEETWVDAYISFSSGVTVTFCTAEEKNVGLGGAAGGGATTGSRGARSGKPRPLPLPRFSEGLLTRSGLLRTVSRSSNRFFERSLLRSSRSRPAPRPTAALPAATTSWPELCQACVRVCHSCRRRSRPCAFSSQNIHFNKITGSAANYRARHDSTPPRACPRAASSTPGSTVRHPPEWSTVLSRTLKQVPTFTVEYVFF